MFESLSFGRLAELNAFGQDLESMKAALRKIQAPADLENSLRILFDNEVVKLKLKMG